jgi:hypothetical protein
VVPSVELNARLPGVATVISCPTASTAFPTRLPFEPGRHPVRRGRRRRAVSRAPVLDGRGLQALDVEGLRGIEVWNGGCERESRAAARAALGRCAAAWPSPVRPGRRRLHHPERQRPGVDGFVRSSETPGRCSTRFAQHLHASAGPRSMSCSMTTSSRWSESCRSVTLSQGSGEVVRAGGAAGLSLPLAGARDGRGWRPRRFPLWRDAPAGASNGTCQTRWRCSLASSGPAVTGPASGET